MGLTQPIPHPELPLDKAGPTPPSWPRFLTSSDGCPGQWATLRPATSAKHLPCATVLRSTFCVNYPHKIQEPCHTRGQRGPDGADTQGSLCPPSFPEGAELGRSQAVRAGRGEEREELGKGEKFLPSCKGGRTRRCSLCCCLQHQTPRTTPKAIRRVHKHSTAGPRHRALHGRAGTGARGTCGFPRGSHTRKGKQTNKKASCTGCPSDDAIYTKLSNLRSIRVSYNNIYRSKSTKKWTTDKHRLQGREKASRKGGEGRRAAAMVGF